MYAQHSTARYDRFKNINLISEFINIIEKTKDIVLFILRDSFIEVGDW